MTYLKPSQKIHQLGPQTRKAPASILNPAYQIFNPGVVQQEIKENPKYRGPLYETNPNNAML